MKIKPEDISVVPIKEECKECFYLYNEKLHRGDCYDLPNCPGKIFHYLRSLIIDESDRKSREVKNTSSEYMASVFNDGKSFGPCACTTPCPQLSCSHAWDGLLSGNRDKREFQELMYERLHDILYKED